LKEKNHIKKIVRLCLKNDRKSQKAFYDEYSKWVYPICKKFGQNPDRTQELFNASFLKIYMKLDTIDDLNKIVHWIKRVTHNTCLDFLRSEKRRSLILEYTDNLDNTLEAPIIISEKKETIDKALAKLKHKKNLHYEVFSMFYEGYSHKEIAQAMGINESLSRYYLSQARKALEATLLKYGIKRNE